MKNPTFLRVACLQIAAGRDPLKNLRAIQTKIARALALKVDLIALPETFYYRGPAGRLPELAHHLTPRLVKEFQRLARRHRVAFLLGSVYEKAPSRGKYYNTCVLISEKGKVLARYRKIHLFDVSLKKKVSVRESRHIFAGHHVVTARWRGVPVGLTICYDLRFPELFRRLSRKGSQILFVPSNFTYPTGKAHWEVLLRARAIENQAFVIAPAQVGVHPSTRIRAFGTSLIVDPWGRVLRRGSRFREEILTARLDLRFLKRLRREFPALRHRRLG